MHDRFCSSAQLGRVFGGVVLTVTLGGLAGITYPWVTRASSAPAPPEAVQMFFVDVEGGQATLIVTSEEESLLIDTGWPENNGRDADRIVAAAKLAGIKKIDLVLLTHYHQDHAGGVEQLAARLPLGTFIDHGENREAPDSTAGQAFRDYQALLSRENHKRIIAKPGDELPLGGIQANVVSADGAVIDKPLPGAGEENPACNTSWPSPADQSENVRSVGVIFSFGRVRILDLGDLTSDKERLLMCPMNKLGRIDVLVVSHHGSLKSSSPALLNGIAPRVAIMDNGATKGGEPVSWDTIEKSPRLEDLWQLHYSNEGGAAHNTAESFIANLRGPDTGNYLKLTVSLDGSFDVYNARTKATKHYASGPTR
jgi:competence protein ComEC